MGLAEEAPLEMARRHVRQGERHVTQQAQIFEELLAGGMDVAKTEMLLATCQEFLAVARERLRIEEMKAAGYTQKMDDSTGLSSRKEPPGAVLLAVRALLARLKPIIPGWPGN